MAFERRPGYADSLLNISFHISVDCVIRSCLHSYCWFQLMRAPYCREGIMDNQMVHILCCQVHGIGSRYFKNKKKEEAFLGPQGKRNVDGDTITKNYTGNRVTRTQIICSDAAIFT